MRVGPDDLVLCFQRNETLPHVGAVVRQEGMFCLYDVTVNRVKGVQTLEDRVLMVVSGTRKFVRNLLREGVK